MKHGTLQRLGVMVTSVMLTRVMPVDVAPPPTDAVPPGPIMAISFGVLCALGLGIAGIVIVSVLVIRAIRKKNLAPKEKDV